MEWILFFILLLVLLWVRSAVLSGADQNNYQIQQLQEEIIKLQKLVVEREKPAAARPAAPKEEAAPVQKVAHVPPPVRPDTPPPVKAPETPPAAHVPPITKPAPKPVPQAQEPLANPEPIAAFMPPVSPPPVPPAEPEPEPASFWERNPDWEKFIGENLINKLGIAILVLGIGFFVKYAIDKDWINEVGRVAIGILCGGVLLGVAHRLREKFAAFSSVLVGGGMAVLFFTIAIAFHEYQLFSQTLAFIFMVILTGFTIFLSLAYNRKELAVLALVGGFASPFMVSTGEGNYIVLFTFVLILDVGVLVLAYYKKWRILNYIAYAFTIILYSGWLSTKVAGVTNAPYAGALVFATLFYLVFFAMNIINNLKEKQKFEAPEIMILLSNTFLYYSAGMFVLHYLGDGRFQGMFTAVLAAFNFGFAYSLYRSQRADLNLVYLLIGLVLTFLSLVAPVQLEGNYITLFWAMEAVLLLWLSQKSGISLLKVASMLVMMLMVISLLIDWQQIYGVVQGEPLLVLLNKGFVTSVIALASMAATVWLLRRETETYLAGIDFRVYKVAVMIGGGLLLYVALLLELSYQLNRFGLPLSAQYMYIGLYHYIFIFGLLLYVRLQASVLVSSSGVGLALLAVIFYPLLNQFVIELRNNFLFEPGQFIGHFLAHYLLVVLVLAMLWLSLQWVKKKYDLKSDYGKFMLWFSCVVLVFMASAELEHLVLLAAYSPADDSYAILTQTRKIGYAILWGISSFIFMLLGMKYKLKTLRIISLSLFTLTLLKLFILDIRNMGEGGKIAAFICLGVLLLVVSFMYQKLKNLILEDDRAAE